MHYRYLYIFLCGLIILNISESKAQEYSTATFTNINKIPANKKFISINQTENSLKKNNSFVLIPTIASQRSNVYSNNTYSPDNFDKKIDNSLQVTNNSSTEDIIPFIVDSVKYSSNNSPSYSTNSNNWISVNNSPNIKNAINAAYTNIGQGSYTLLTNAKKLLGIPYRYGGNTPSDGLDCSGFVRYVYYYTLGIVLPRRSAEIGQIGSSVNNYSLKAGDLVFFNTTGQSLSHLGIYMGDGTFIHAPSTGSNIRIDTLSSKYWATRYEGARRIASLN